MKRRLIERVVLDKRGSWTQTELADAIGANPKGSINDHLAALVQLGVLWRRGALYYPQRHQPLFRALAGLLAALASVRDVKLKRPA